MNILKRSFNDFMSVKFLGLSFATLFVPFCVLGFLVILGGGELFELLSQGANSGDFSYINDEQYPIIAAILKFSLIKWLIVTLFYTVGTMLVVLLSLFVAIVVLGFFTPYIVNTLHKKYYQNVYIEKIDNLEVIKQMSWIFLKFLLFFILCLPFFWVPIVIHVPFFYLFYKFMSIDVGSNMMSKERLKDASKRYRSEFLLLSLSFFILSLIPVLGIFLQLFFVIYFTHFYFQKELIGNAR